MDKNIQNKLLEARKLLEQYAPKGEFLAFINKEEANLLKQFGGSGRITESGIPSFDTTNTQQNINLPAPYIQAAGQNALDIATSLAGQPINTAGFAPTVAPQSVLTQQAQQLAATQAGLGTLQFDPTTGSLTGMQNNGSGIAGYQPYLNQAAAYSGPQAYQQFMSPYQQDVINSTLGQYDIQAQQGALQNPANAISAGAFGGARQGVQQGVYQSQSDLNRSLLQAQLLNQGFSQAQGQANTAFGQQQGLASLQPSLAQASIQQLGGAGTNALAYQQSVQNAQAQAAQPAAYEPYQRSQFLTSTIGGLTSGYPQFQSGATGTANVSPLQSAISTAANVYGISSLFGGNQASDFRLKEDIQLVGQSPSGINIYTFKYFGDATDTTYKGVMAHEVPHVSFLDKDGYYKVDYSKTDVKFEKVV